jgi:lantibiotic transport system permease protein
MSFIISTQVELLKTKRTSSLWLSVAGAAFIPLMLFISFFAGDDASKVALLKDPWTKYLSMGWELFNILLLPMYIILICTLITQIEYRNNGWKQVFASPQSFGNIFFSKFLTIHVIIIFSFMLFNFFVILGAVLANVINPKFTFLSSRINWQTLLQLNLKTYIATLGITAVQYWVSLRFKNFIAPLGIGVALVIIAIVAMAAQSAHIYKYPYSFPILTYDFMQKKNRPFLENHELNSIGYFIFFLLLGFLDMRLRKEKG